MNTFLKYAKRALDYLIWAGFFGLLTVWYWFISNGNMLNAYFWNVVGISAGLFIDNRRIGNIYKKLKICENDEARAKLSKKDVASAKTSLYLFYIFALIFSQVLTMDTSIAVSENARSYFQVTGYGLILLFAIDNFLKYVMDDDKRVKKFQEECSSQSEKSP
ncbi:MAG: hypothetical protein FWE34_01265 [Defluviitaleaceae bacterium]|nr:hypothetical protein [Defluviitaleaceae bacterium]